MTFGKMWIYRVLLAALAIAGSQISLAAVPDGINYQAYLADSSGAPIDTDVSITFAAYTVDVGGVPVWSQTDLVSPDNGLFSVTLGNPVNPFPANLFDTQIFIGLFVAGEEMLPRRALWSAPYSFKAADADTLTGFTSTDLDQSSDVDSLNTSVSTLQSDLSTTQDTVTGLVSDVADNTSGIGSNASDIASNDGRISTLEATGGDITEVLAGPGLTGGATSGSAAIKLAAGGVTAANLANNAVTGAAIADGSIQPADLNPTPSYTVGGLVNNGTSELNGALTVNSGQDIKINDNWNGFRWYSADGVTQYFSIETRESNTALKDKVRGRTMIESNAQGIGIGTALPVDTHDVTIPSLAVTGNIDIGLERVSSSYSLSNNSSSCHSHGNLPCYYGSGNVTCPVGKRVLGGGSSGSTAVFGSIAQSLPQTNTSFTCAASYDIANATRTCYAICARVD